MGTPIVDNAITINGAFEAPRWTNGSEPWHERRSHQVARRPRARRQDERRRGSASRQCSRSATCSSWERLTT
jgi:hypothetical protein